MPTISIKILVAKRVAISFFKNHLEGVFQDKKTGFWKAIQKDAATGTAGDRLFPKKDSNKDVKYGVRIDLGEKTARKVDNKTMYFRNLILQINSKPANPALKEAAGRNGTHAKRIEFEVPLNEKGDGLHSKLKEDHVDEVIKDLAKNGV